MVILYAFDFIVFFVLDRRYTNIRKPACTLCCADGSTSVEGGLANGSCLTRLEMNKHRGSSLHLE